MHIQKKRQTEKERLFEVDGLKGIAGLGIAFIYHYRGFWDSFSKLAPYTGYVARFVELFVLISGFMMSYNYMDRMEDTTFPHFFKKRYLKLMPLYWVTFFACLIVRGLWWNNGTFTVSYLLLDIIGLGRVVCPNYFPINDPAWTINVLLVCYVLFFCLVKVKNRSENVYYILLFSFLSLSLAGIINNVSAPFFDVDSTLRGYAAFLVGMLLYEVTAVWEKDKVQLLTYALIALLVIFFGVSKYMGVGMGNDSVNSILLFGPTLLLIVIYTPLKRIFSTRVFRFIGKISMSVFMWHYLWLYIVLILGLVPSGKGLAVMFIGTIATSIFSTYLLEPALNHIVQKVVKF